MQPFKEKSNPRELMVAQPPLPCVAPECHTSDTVTATRGCFWHISHTSPELQKWAIRTVFHLEIWIFSTTNIFFPGRQHCQNVLFMQSSKREKKMPTKLKIWSQLNLNGAPITPIFLKLLRKCLSLIRLSYFKACPVVVICLWYRVALWSWMFIFIETLLSVSG